MDDVSYALGLASYGEIEALNPDMNIESIRPGQLYEIPYISPLESPATWSTLNCKPTLHLQGGTIVETLTPSKKSSASTLSTETSSHFASASLESISSTLTTSTLISTATSVPAKKASPQHCRQKGKYFTDEGLFLKQVDHFCTENKSTSMSAKADSITFLYQGTKKEIYQYSVTWIEDCTHMDEQLLNSDGPTCKEIMTENFRKCDNGGKGGSKRKDCLMFEYRANILQGEK